jgi:hypothetical protein
MALSQAAATTVCQLLWRTEHIAVDAYVEPDGWVNVWSVGAELTTLDEATALGAFIAVTDSHIAWHKAVVA